VLPEHDGLASATFGPTVAAGLLGALLAIVPGAAAAASTGGDPPPPGDGTPPDDAPVLEPADDDDVVILDTEDQGGDPTNPGPAERDDTGDRSGVLESARLDLAGVVGVALLSFLSLALAAVSATRLRRMLHAWWSPPRATTGDPGGEPPTLSFSLIVTDGGDDEGFARTLEALAVFDHPDVEILAVVGHSESRARELAAAAYRQPQRVRVVVDRGFRRSEPRALNAGLAECRGDVVGVFRAGDEVRPGLLRHVEATLGTTGADAVQSGVLLTSGRPSWLAVRRMVESYFWFHSRLHHHAQQRFTPLATTSMFVRADVLRDAGGWDEAAVGAGCELGVRLSLAGVPVAVTWDPEVVTRAAMPPSAGALLRQQMRWIQGFLQALRAGAWRRLPSQRQRLLAGGTLAMPFLEATAGASTLLLVAATVAAGAPAPLVLAACLPLVPALMTVVVEMAGLGEVGRIAGMRIGLREGLLFLLGAVPYQFLRATGALRALVYEARGKRAGDVASRAGDGAADRDPDAEPTDRPQLVQRAVGPGRPSGDVAIRAEVVDR
jgi:glycosyltransferase XagB